MQLGRQGCVGSGAPALDPPLLTRRTPPAGSPARCPGWCPLHMAEGSAAVRVGLGPPPTSLGGPKAPKQSCPRRSSMPRPPPPRRALTHPEVVVQQAPLGVDGDVAGVGVGLRMGGGDRGGIEKSWVKRSAAQGRKRRSFAVWFRAASPALLAPVQPPKTPPQRTPAPPAHVEEAVPQDLDEVGLRRAARHEARVDAARLEPRLVADLDACGKGGAGVGRGRQREGRGCVGAGAQLASLSGGPDASRAARRTRLERPRPAPPRPRARPAAPTRKVLQREHAAAAELPVHDGRLDPFGAAEVAAEAVGVAALVDVVDLLRGVGGGWGGVGGWEGRRVGELFAVGLGGGDVGGRQAARWNESVRAAPRGGWAPVRTSYRTWAHSW
jgi:hypothetical protein